MGDPKRLDDEFWRGLLETQARERNRLFYKLAYGVLRDRSAAEDACQQAFLAAWKSRREILKPEALTAWLCRSVVNASLTQLRRRLEKNARQQLPVTSFETDPIETLERHELLMAALARLPEAERIVVVLRVMEGLTGRKVATIVDCSPAEVSRRLHRGLEQMRQYFSRRQLLPAELP
ncbi:MAG: sigma-70 family RNA polymerase sigma factor [Pirellulales bacterium]|nr:sigma-70 family RNA polymerase sigma factor [Pirellulales bacterium]